MSMLDSSILGWDIGGVNTKAVRLDGPPGDAAHYRAASRPFAMQHGPAGLGSVVRQLANQLGSTARHAVTMTAELSQAFRTKREGVGFVLDALADALPDATFRIYTTDNRFVSPDEARALPLAVGAANWMATAAFVARSVPTCLLIDIGTTSTDIIPIVDGEVRAAGRTDLERLSTGELIYTGAIRTPAEALVRTVPVHGRPTGVAAESFTVVGDAHIWLGRLREVDYTVPTPDGRPPHRAFAGERLARLVCADREMLDDGAIDCIAQTVADAQLHAVIAGIEQVLHRHRVPLAVVTGLGDFIAADAARRVGLRVQPLADTLGPAAQVAAAAAVASLLADEECH